MSLKPWDTEDDELLKRAWSSFPPNFDLLRHRSRHACEVRASRLGLKSPSGYNFWTDEEVEILREIYATWPRDYGRLPNHSRVSITGKAQALRLIGPLPPQYEHVSEIEWAYLAGIIDGEGTIMPVTQKTGNVYYQLSIANTDLELIDWIRTHFPGAGFYCSKAGSGRRTKDCWVARWTYRDLVRELLTNLLPHLIIKRAKAEEALASLQA